MSVADAPASGAAPSPQIKALSVSDADEEARHAVREVVAAAGRGTPLGRCAIVYGSHEPYARLVCDALDAAGIERCGATARTAATSWLGRSLLDLLELRHEMQQPRGASNSALMSWLGRARVLVRADALSRGHGGDGGERSGRARNSGDGGERSGRESGGDSGNDSGEGWGGDGGEGRGNNSGEGGSEEGSSRRVRACRRRVTPEIPAARISAAAWSRPITSPPGRAAATTAGAASRRAQEDQGHVDAPDRSPRRRLPMAGPRVIQARYSLAW